MIARTLLHATYEQVIKSQHGKENTLVATDDPEIESMCISNKIPCTMTSAAHLTRSDRIAEVIQRAGQADLDCVVNVQGDEPFLNPDFVDLTVEHLLANPQAHLSTIALRVTSSSPSLSRSSQVKVVCDRQRFALYFSRAPIPPLYTLDTRELRRVFG